MFIFAYEGETETQTETPPVSFTQEQVNAFNKAERLKREAAEAKAKELQGLLDSVRNEKNLTESEKAELSKRLEELEQSRLTDEEKKKLEQTKLQKKYDEEKKALSDQLSQTTQNYHNLLIARAITEAAMEGSVVAIDGTGNQALMILKSQSFVNEEGNVMVKDFTWTDGGKTFVETLPAKEAIEKMKSMQEWGNFWKDPSKPGWHSHTPGPSVKEIDISKLSQAEYRELRNAGKIPWAATKG